MTLRYRRPKEVSPLVCSLCLGHKQLSALDLEDGHYDPGVIFMPSKTPGGPREEVVPPVPRMFADSVIWCPRCVGPR